MGAFLTMIKSKYLKYKLTLSFINLIVFLKLSLKLQEMNSSNHLNGDSIYHLETEGLNSFEMNTNNINTSKQLVRPNSYVNCNRLDYYSNGRCQNGYEHLNGQNMNGQRLV